jgi:hypothetical protein
MFLVKSTKQSGDVAHHCTAPPETPASFLGNKVRSFWKPVALKLPPVLFQPSNHHHLFSFLLPKQSRESTTQHIYISIYPYKWMRVKAQTPLCVTICSTRRSEENARFSSFSASCFFTLLSPHRAYSLSFLRIVLIHSPFSASCLFTLLSPHRALLAASFQNKREYKDVSI